MNYIYGTANNTAVTYSWSSWMPPDVNGTAGVRVPVWTPPPTGGAAAVLQLPISEPPES